MREWTEFYRIGGDTVTGDDTLAVVCGAHLHTTTVVVREKYDVAHLQHLILTTLDAFVEIDSNIWSSSEAHRDIAR